MEDLVTSSFEAPVKTQETFPRKIPTYTNMAKVTYNFTRFCGFLEAISRVPSKELKLQSRDTMKCDAVYLTENKLRYFQGDIKK